MIKNLIIGGEGFIGIPLQHYLRSLGESVTSFDIKQGVDARNVKFERDSYDIIYFLAWDVGGSKYLYNPGTQTHQMIWNLKLLLNLMPQLEGRRFLFVSSQLSDRSDISYGVTKKLGELWSELIAGISIRLWNVYGPFEKNDSRSHVVSDFVSQAINQDAITMMTRGNERRQFVHIHDVCRGFHMAAHSGLIGRFDLTSSEWVSIYDLANMIKQETGCKIHPGDPVGEEIIVRPSNIFPGWNPVITLEEGIKSMIGEVREKCTIRS